MRTVLGTLATLGLCVSTALAGTITVDVNDGACVSGSGQPDPYSVVYCSIQDAIDDAVAGDTINVAAGIYVEQITITESLSLIGAGEDVVTIQAPAADRPGSVIEGAYTWDYMLAAYATSGTIDVRVEGFTFDANGEGKSSGTDRFAGVFMRDVDGATSGLFSCTIGDFGTTEYESWGVWVGGASDLTIDDNALSGYTHYGMVINGDGDVGEDPDVVVSNNDLTGSSTPLNGIQIGYGATGRITGNTVRDHTRSSPSAAVGIFVIESDGITLGSGNTVNNCFYGLLLSGSDGSTVFENTFTDNIAYHIGLDGSNNNEITANTITGTATGTEDTAIGLSNGATGNIVGGSTFDAGNEITLATSGGGLLHVIHMQSTVGAGSNTVQCNSVHGGTRFVQVDGGNTGAITIADNLVGHSGPSFAGVYLDGGSAVITGNTLTNTVRPVELWGAQDVTISGNIIDGWDYDGVNVGSFTGTVAVSNNFLVNPWGMGVNNRTTTPIDAENNWWGDASGPLDTVGSDEADNPPCYDPATMLNADGLGNPVSEYVDYCPWLTTAPPQLALEADADCYNAGDTVTVGIWMRDIEQTIVGGQFFLRYDNGTLDFLDIGVGDPPFTIEVFSSINEAAAKIDYAVGIPEGGSGTSADTMMAVITFEALTQICSASELIFFRSHTPPSRLSDDTNTPVYPLLVDLDVIDDIAPTATQGTIDTCYTSVAEAETAALAATTDPTDNCTDPNDLVITVATVGDCSAAVTVTVTDGCGNFTDYVYDTRIDNTPPTATQGTIDTCYASVAGAEAAAIAATTAPTDNCSDPNDIVITAATVGDCSAVVTVSVTDECGNFTDYIYNTRIDGTSPTATQGAIDACYTTVAEAETAALAATTDPTDDCTDPNDLVITVGTVGDCAAAVTVTVTDECGNFNDYVYNTRIDSAAPTATQGTIDACYTSSAEAEAAAVTATTDPTDDCSDPNDIVLSAVAVGDCSATVTVTVTDECGNFTDYVYNTRIDGTSPTATQGSIDACYTTVAEAETAALSATTDPTDNCSDPNDIVVTVGTVGDCDAAVTVTVTDECGNFTDYVYNTRIDDTPPTATQGTIDSCYATAAEAEAAAIAATDPTDDCSDPNDIILSAATVGDCSAVVTVTVTDECGNFTDYVYNTRVDNTPPTATVGTIDTCYASAAEAEAAAITATTDPNDDCSDPNDIVISAATVGDCSAVVTVTVTDECGNFTEYDYNTRVDGEAPVVTPSADMNVYADAGLCTAAVDPGTATADDNCTVSLTVTGTRDDALELTDPYPQGITTITWESTDECGNTGSALQTITVSDYNEVVLDIELKAITEASLTRCITFEFWNCGTETAETVEQEITFTNGLATAVSVEVPCAVYDCVRARDGLHTLWRTDVDVFGIVGTQYVADFTDASGTGGDDDSLIGGNLFDDVPPYAPPQFVDIMDYAVFINAWAVNYGTGDTTCATAWPHADISGDGEVTSPDFTFIQTYFLYTDETACCGLLGGGSGPRTEISVAELHELGLPELTVADLNYDGWVDEADVVAFLNGVLPDGPGLIEDIHGVPSGGARIGSPSAARPRSP